MTKNVVVTARIDADLSAALDKLGATLDRSRAWIVARAIERYVTEESEFMAFIQEGVDDLEAGRFHTQEEVEEMFSVDRAARDAA